ncbi:MAG: hypothetical protein AAGD22_02465 [Verrucomicrobiota bacterium]
MSSLLAGTVQPLIACATCMGDANSPVVQGFNFAVLLMLGILVLVLGSFLSFIRYLARRQKDALLLIEESSERSRGRTRR